MQDRILSLAFEGQRREVGQFAQRDVDLARRAARAEVLDRRDKFIGEIFLFHKLEERTLWVCSGHHDSGCEFIAVLENHAHGAPTPDLDLLHARVDSDLHPERFCRVENGAADSARAVLGKAPGAERTINFAHVVMKQNVRRPGRARTQECADDPAGSFRAFQRVGLEPLFEQIRAGLCGELGDGIQFFFREACRVATDLEQIGQVARAKRRWVRRDQAEEGFDRFRGARHDAGIFIVGFCVLRRVTVDLLAGQVMVVPRGEVIPVFHRSERAGQWQDLQPVFWQLQVTDDLRAQQADHV
jgi:hypothetical protein